MTQTLVIRGKTDLAQLLARPAPHRIALAIPGKTAADQEQWQNRLSRRVRACGCGLASAVMLVGLIPAAIITWQPTVFGLGSFPRWGIALTIVIGFAFAGKGLGLLRARRQLREEVSDFAAWIATPHKE